MSAEKSRGGALICGVGTDPSGKYSVGPDLTPPQLSQTKTSPWRADQDLYLEKR